MKNAVIIQTKNFPRIVEVENFSKDNCLEAIRKGLGVDVDKIEQISASPSMGIYGVTEIFPSLVDAVGYVESNGYCHTITIEHGQIV